MDIYEILDTIENGIEKDKQKAELELLGKIEYGEECNTM